MQVLLDCQSTIGPAYLVLLSWSWVTAGLHGSDQSARFLRLFECCSLMPKAGGGCLKVNRWWVFKTSAKEKLYSLIFCKIGWTTYNSWLAFWQSSKGFYWPKARRKAVQKSSDISVYNTINREEVRRSRRWYIIPTTTSPNLFPVNGVVHRKIGTFLYIFSSRFRSVKSFNT